MKFIIPIEYEMSQWVRRAVGRCASEWVDLPRIVFILICLCDVIPSWIDQHKNTSETGQIPKRCAAMPLALAHSFHITRCMPICSVMFLSEKLKKYLAGMIIKNSMVRMRSSTDASYKSIRWRSTKKKNRVEITRINTRENEEAEATQQQQRCARNWNYNI